MSMEIKLPTVLPGQETLLNQPGVVWGSRVHVAGDQPWERQMEPSPVQ